MLVSIIIIFFICWTPRLLFYFVYHLPGVSMTLGEFDDIKPWLELVSYINSCVNAYIYYLSSE